MAAKQAMAQRLRSLGFRKLGPHLNRDTGEVVHGIHFQASQFGLHDDGSFTVNLVVTWRTLFESYVGHPFPRYPATAAFPSPVRIGDLMGDGRDHWWDVNEKTDLDELCDNVVRTLFEVALPFFDRFPDKKSVLTAFRNRRQLFSRSEPLNRVVHAIIAYELDLLDEAREQFEIAIAKSQIEEGRQHILSLQARLGVS